MLRPITEGPYGRDCWANDPVICLGGGPSLTTCGWENLYRDLPRPHVIGTNQAYEFPEVELCFILDQRFAWMARETPRWAERRRQGMEVVVPGIRVWTNPKAAYTFDEGPAWWLPIAGPGIWQDDLKAGITHFRSSGMYTLLLATALTRGPICLAGYDMVDGDGRHWHNAYPKGWKKRDHYRPERDDTLLVPGEIRRRVANLNPKSGIETFRRHTWKEVLNDCRETESSRVREATA